MRVVIAAIHGIMTGGTNPSWPDQFEAWAFDRDPELHVLTRHYFDLPLPLVNWFKNRWQAAGLANELELYLGCAPLHMASPVGVEHPPIWLVAHSNGAVIALMTARRLIARGHKVGGLILTGAACEADLRKNGIAKWIELGELGSAIAYASEDDAVVAGDPRVAPRWYWRLRDWIWGKLMWPYGCLGRTGWMLAGRGYFNLYCARAAKLGSIFTRWYRGGHSTYFTDRSRNCTFEQIYQDIQGATESAI